MQLEGKKISFRYSDQAGWVLREVDLTVRAGEKLALAGPSGFGKSTLAKVLAGYEQPCSGAVLLDGKPLAKLGYCPVQMIHQHPELAVNPRWKMGKILNECWTPDAALLKTIGIEQEWLSRWPAELSSGELQRFCIARVLGPGTKFLICDEISAMLDVITQAQIWQLLLQIAEKKGLGLIVITHNLALAGRICDRVIQLPEINQIRPIA